MPFKKLTQVIGFIPKEKEEILKKYL